MSTQEEPRGNTLNGSTYQGVSQLLNSIARDLDHMLYELGQSPPVSPVNSHIIDEFSSGSHYRRAAFQQSTQNNSRNSSGDALLEQFVQNLIDSLTLPGTPDGRSSVLSSTSLCTLGLNGGGQSSDNSSQISEHQKVTSADEDDDDEGSADQACDISVLERIIRTHHVWFLPSITRAGATHLLQGKDTGNFIVRNSSKPNTNAISVRLPNDKGPHVEHYLIEATGREYHLEGSVNHFEAIPTLVAHYCQCCDELPVQLTLPQAIKTAMTRQELSSIAMLGQEFWASSIAKPTTPPPEGSELQSAMISANTLTGLPFPLFSTFGHKTSSTSTALVTSSYSTQDCDSSSSLTCASSVTELKTANPSPPPPPPRWCKPSSSLSTTTTTNFTVTTTVTFNVNQTITNLPVNNVSNKLSTVPCTNEPSKRPQTLTNASNGKSVKYRKKPTHYKQSNVIDSPPDYYRSSLADKISDYEDIWGTPSKPETPQSESKFEFITFKSKNSVNVKNPSRKENQKNNDCLNNLNQTDFEKAQAIESDTYVKENSSEVKENKNRNSGNSQSQSGNLPNKMNQKNCSLQSVAQTDKKPDSPFYTEPIDAINTKEQIKNCKYKLKNGSIGKIKSRTKIPPRLLSHRHSDPNIQWPLPRNGGALETIFAAEDVQAMSSSLDNLNNRNSFSSSNKTGFVNAGFYSHSSQISTSSKPNENNIPFKINLKSLIKHPISCENSPSPVKFTTQKCNPNKSFTDSSWRVDTSWEWCRNNDELGNDSDFDDESTVESLIRKDAKFPLGDFRKETSLDSTSIQCSDLITVEDLIQQKSPDLHVPEIQPLTKSNLLRVSEYDNLDENITHEKDNLGYDPSETASSVTEFSEPWDSSRWDNLLQPSLKQISETEVIQEEEEKERKENHFNASIEENEIKKMQMQINKQQGISSLDISNETAVNSSTSISIAAEDGTSLSSAPISEFDQNSTTFVPKSKTSSSMYKFLPKKKNKILGDSIKEYVLSLSQDNGTIFGKTIENFIQCTLESHETNPHVVMRNVRQFMSGIKNYLVKHGEGLFEMVVQKERSKLKANEFLNLDAILESVLNKIVIKPLKKYIYQLFVNEYTRNGSLKYLSDSIKFARTKIPEEFGIKPGANIPQGITMDNVHRYLRKLQVVYSPMKKLDNLLAATGCIFETLQKDQPREEISMGNDGKSNRMVSFNTILAGREDDFLPLLMYVLVHCGMIAAEIEADYMWGLLHPSLLTGEGSYYLTTLSSAVHVLKNFQRCHEHQFKIYNSVETKETMVPNLSDMQGFMKILIPDELNGSIIFKTFPIRPSMNTKEVGKMIAHKFNITNPQDYALFKLVNGEETLLLECECPHSVKADLLASGVDCAFAYKRVDAKIAWPLISKS